MNRFTRRLIRLRTFLPLIFLLGSFCLAPPATAATAALTVQQRSDAARTTSTSNAQCKAIQPYYWEIGDAAHSIVSATSGGTEPAAGTEMQIASASKWIFGAYVAQLRNGQLSHADIKALTMNSGYTGLEYQKCIRLIPRRQEAETVAECFHDGGNDAYDPADENRFFYNGGHFQKYAAVDLNLGNANNASLHDAIARLVGNDFSFSYSSPQLAAGISTTAADYAQFLRKILHKDLFISNLLGADAVCTNPKTCPSAASTPVPDTESWHYSIAHWVEDDPAVGDGAFSSPGAFGFYPWIDSSRSYYGIVARHKLALKAYYESVQCGRQIRKAWLTGKPQ